MSAGTERVEPAGAECGERGFGQDATSGSAGALEQDVVDTGSGMTGWRGCYISTIMEE